MKIQRIIVGELQTNCYLLVDGGELAVIDPGDDAPEIIFRVKESGAKTKLIIDTHYHYDHTGANEKLKNATGAAVAIHEDERHFVDFAADRWLKEGDIITVGQTGFKVLHTPGHTKGSICLLGDGFLFSGDTIFDQAVGRVDLPGGSAGDMKKSLAKLDKLIPKNSKVYPGHGEPFIFHKGEITKWI